MSQPEEVVSPISVSKERDDSSSDNMEDAVEKQVWTNKDMSADLLLALASL